MKRGYRPVQVEAKPDDVVRREKRERLQPEDSIYFDSTLPRLVRCYGEQPARIPAVLYTQGKNRETGL